MVRARLTILVRLCGDNGRTTRRHPEKPLPSRQPARTITAENGTEFYDNTLIAQATGAAVYFTTPHRAGERGTNEATDGLPRQYLRKGQSMAHVTQPDCTCIARALNTRRRKRHHCRTPEECDATLA